MDQSSIRELFLLEGARRASGLAIVIDVFRATSHIATLLALGAREVIPAASLDAARELKRLYPDSILAGERHGLPPDDFELGNSPWEAALRRFDGRTVILATTAGSKGLVAAARSAGEVVAGAFVNAEAVVAYARARAPERVSLVALGKAGLERSPEDDLAAAYIHARLRNREPDFDAMCATIRAHPEGRKFLDPENPNYRAEDLPACLALNRYHVVPRMDGDGAVRAVE